MRKQISMHAVHNALRDHLGPHSSETGKVLRWESGRPVSVERRGVRHVNVWIEVPATLAGLPACAEVYPPQRPRNWQLSPRLRTGNGVVRIPVATEEELDQVMKLLASFKSN